MGEGGGGGGECKKGLGFQCGGHEVAPKRNAVDFTI